MNDIPAFQTATTDQMVALLTEVGGVAFQMYESLIHIGFGSDQAFELVRDWHDRYWAFILDTFISGMLGKGLSK